MSTETLIIASFVAGLVPMAIFVLHYGLRTRWYESRTGQLMFAMASTLAVSYLVSVLTLTIPGFFKEESGEWVRIIIRFILAGVSWVAVISLFRIQKAGERKSARHKEEV